MMGKKKIPTLEEEFKTLVKDMHRGFPRFRYYNVEQKIPTESDRQNLIKHGFFLEETMDGKKVYSLGPNGLLLVSAWKMEDLTNRLLLLTLMMALVSILSVAVALETLFRVI